MSSEESGLLAHAKRELDLIGMTHNPDGQDRLGRDGVLELIHLFSTQGHSGSSALWMLETVERLLRYEPLSPLTDDPAEWMDVADDLWQSRRKPDAFSCDGGKTYYLVDDKIANDGDLSVTPVYMTKHREPSAASGS